MSKDTCPIEEQVEVVDLTHPLFGRRFRLVAVTRALHSGGFARVEYRPGITLAAARGFAGRRSELVLALPGGDECVLAVGPDAVSLRITGAAMTCIGRMRRPRLRDGFTAFERPPGVEDPETLDAAALHDIRRARSPSELRRPVTMEELERWRRTHCFGRPVEG